MDSQWLREPAKTALDFLAGRVNYERVPVPYRSQGFKLDRMRELLARLGDPHLQYPTIHIAGTKGKGSTAAFIANSLNSAGYRTGLYTSPHLHSLVERFQIGGEACSLEDLEQLVNRVRPWVEDLDRAAERGEYIGGPTWFEITTAMAFLYFAARKVDVTVLEVGLGGRLDSTNVCEPIATVISSISYDHMQQLGNTLAEIAAEKGGIIKPHVPLISGVIESEPRRVIEQIAAEKNCPYAEIGRDFQATYFPPGFSPNRNGASWEPTRHNGLCGSIDFEELTSKEAYQIRNLRLGLAGRHQGANAAVAIATLRTLIAKGWRISEASIRKGIAETVWPARVEVMSEAPLVVVDSAHNAASAEALVETLSQVAPRGKRFLVLAASREKDIAGMLRALLPYFDVAIFTQFQNNQRGMPAEELLNAAREIETSAEPTSGHLSKGKSRHACELHTCELPDEAWRRVRSLAKAEDQICVTGSFFIAAEIRPLIEAGGSQ